MSYMTGSSCWHSHSKSWLTTIAILFLRVASVLADCECGYSTAVNATTYTFTDLTETDFLHLGNISTNTDWQLQGYNVTAIASRGTYGTAFQVDNVVSNPLANNASWAGAGVGAGNPGLQLYVRGGVPTTGLVATAALDSNRSDMLVGSYRTAMKLSSVSGTCAAFFWYFNDSQEIDMEFLSHQFNKSSNSFPVNLVMQSLLSADQGYQVAGKNYIVADLAFDPTIGYHEYRIDIFPGTVIFYADSVVLATMPAQTTPLSPGHLILTHWSNGNTGWSYGPPTEDAVMTVSYVKAYFNSSSSVRQKAFSSRCIDPGATAAVCAIPDQTAAPNVDGADGNVTAKTFFFMNQNNETNGQVVSRQSGAVHPAYMMSLSTYGLLVFVGGVIMTVT